MKSTCLLSTDLDLILILSDIEIFYTQVHFSTTIISRLIIEVDMIIYQFFITEGKMSIIDLIGGQLFHLPLFTFVRQNFNLQARHSSVHTSYCMYTQSILISM